jgi:solute carrier family 25 (mitochondrial oxoglutarate transporter), member 11
MAETGVKKPQELGMASKFFSAGLAGCLGWMMVHPFNTAAIRMNLAQKTVGVESVSFGGFLMQNLKTPKKALGLYDGLAAGVLRQVFYASSRFGLFEVFRDEMAKYRPTDIWSRLATGCASGAVAALISCPAETTLVRLSNDSTLPVEKRRNYTSVANAFTRILREEGLVAFFSASGPFVNRAIIVGAVQVGTLDQFKETYRGYGITDQLQNTFCSAMSSGLLYSIATMPLESAKNRIAFQIADPATGLKPYKSAIQTVGKIAAEEGIGALYYGFAPYYLRCGGHTVAMFVWLDFIRKFMQS